MNCNYNPFANDNVVADAVASRILMKICSHKEQRLDLIVHKSYILDSERMEASAQLLELDKWRVVIRRLLNSDKKVTASKKDWLIYQTITAFRPYEKCNEAHLIVATFDSVEEAENLCNYLTTKFVIFLVAYKQIEKRLKTHSNNNLAWDSFEYVPVQDFFKSWTDEELYSKYRLDKEEIAFIDSTIKTDGLDVG